MEPTKTQAGFLGRMAGARRFIWNWALRRWKDYHAEHGKSISLALLSAELTALKQQPETAWLNEIDSQALQQALKGLYGAFVNFFEKRHGIPGSRAGNGTGRGFASLSGSRSRMARSLSPRWDRCASARVNLSRERPKARRFAAMPGGIGSSRSPSVSSCLMDRCS